jgi:hypothetical protein
MITDAERIRRDRAIALLRAFAAGKLTNDEFEARFKSILDPRPVREWEDRTLWALKSVVWYAYDDLSTHRLEGPHALTTKGKKDFARWILFLQTDRTYEWRCDDFMLTALRDWLLGRMTFGWWIKWRAKKMEAVDWAIWPFRRSEDLERARMRHRL